jgi:DNA-binding response OmpR family regulator
MRVLVVEDEPLIAMLVRHALTRAGHEVVGPVSSVAVALRLAQEQPIDLALLDIDLGRGGSGVHLARCLHERQGPPCLFASGSYDEAHGACDVALGVLSKPYGAEDLVLAVAAAEAVLAGAQPVRVPHVMELFCGGLVPASEHSDHTVNGR